MNQLNAFLWAIGQQESGGHYGDVNHSSGALGKYQVLPSNVPGWTKEALGHSLTPQQYLASPAAQEAVARHVLGGYFHKYGPQGAASAWYSGNPNLYKSTAPQSGGPSVAGYVSSVIAKMNTATSGKVKVPKVPASTSTTGGGGTGGGAQNASFLGGVGNVIGSLSPLALLGGATGGIVGKATSGLEQDLAKLAVSTTGLAVAAALIIGGMYQIAKPANNNGGSSGGSAPAAPVPAGGGGGAAAAGVPEEAAVLA